jgi:hypothetical protein
MNGTPRRRLRLPLFGAGLLSTALLMAVGATPAGSAPAKHEAVFSEAVAFDTSKPLRELAKTAKIEARDKTGRMSPERGPTVKDKGYSGDAAVQAFSALSALATIGGTIANFEGLSQNDNFARTGRRVNPPDPVGDVGPNHYVEMINLVFGVYSKTGTRLLGPLALGDLWAGFPIEDCTDESGDPIVLYDQTTNRWILTQFTTRGLNPMTPTLPFYNCIAISQTGDPTGAYYRYAFITQPDPDGGYFFPDYPKYGVWRDSYIMTSRDIGFDDGYGISVYALEKNKMVNGEPGARAVQFFLNADDVPINLIGDGLLPPDLDGTTKPKNDVPAPIVGTQDDGGPYGATFDALNVWELDVKWRSTPIASIALKGQLPVASFDSIFPCGVVPGSEPPSARDCLPQPGITDGSQYLDILSYRQRPMWRLAYRNKGAYESMVTNQSVEALPGVAGVRWYELRRTGGTYSVFQQGTYAPNDGVHRWMGSIAADKNGNMALGYSVVNGTTVFPGIRYTGRLAGDALGQMALGEGVIVNGTGVQTNTNSRWGDYTSMNVDPVDDCTFWYVNEYYTVTEPPPDRNWQTRIASFKLPGC